MKIAALLVNGLDRKRKMTESNGLMKAPMIAVASASIIWTKTLTRPPSN
jgi:hypothetical protein